MVEAASELEGSYDDLMEKATSATERGMKMGSEDFKRLNPGAAAFLKSANAFEKPYKFQHPAGISFVTDEPIRVVEPTGEVAVDAGVLEQLEKEAEEEGAEEGENESGADTEVVEEVAQEEGVEKSGQGGRQGAKREWP
jgi:hypothetical protein